MSWFEITAYSTSVICAVWIICLPFALAIVIHKMHGENGGENER